MEQVHEPLKFTSLLVYSFLQLPHIVIIILLNYAAFILYADGLAENNQFLFTLAFITIFLSTTWAVALLMKLLIDAQSTAIFRMK